MWRSPAPSTRVFVIASLSVALMTSTPNEAQSPALEPAKLIATCIEDAEKASRDPYATCFGKISDPCLETPEGLSTHGQGECIDKERAVWDDFLNREYRALLAAVPEAAKPRLREAQRAWVRYRDLDCITPYHFFEGGTMAQPMVRQCHARETARRAMHFRSWRKTLEP